VLDSLNKVIVP